MTKIIFVALFFLLILCGCASFSDEPSTVILQNPETMEFVNCTVDQWGTSKSYQRNLQCVEEYKKLGYVVWGER